MTSCHGCRLQVLKEVSISDPRVPVYSNATAQPVASAGEVAGLLARQLVEPVRWEDTLRDLIVTGKTEMVRCYCRSHPALSLGYCLDSATSSLVSKRASEPLCISNSCCDDAQLGVIPRHITDRLRAGGAGPRRADQGDDQAHRQRRVEGLQERRFVALPLATESNSVVEHEAESADAGNRVTTAYVQWQMPFAQQVSCFGSRVRAQLTIARSMHAASGAFPHNPSRSRSSIHVHQPIQWWDR